MPIKSYKVGPGSLVLGTGGTVLDVSCQMTNARVEPTENVKSTDPIDVLCGESLDGEESATYAYRLKGSLLQDLEAAGVCAYTWTNAGDEVPFVLVPNTDADRQVSGTVRVAPITIGGAVSKTERPSSDIDWAIIGTPTFGPTA